MTLKKLGTSSSAADGRERRSDRSAFQTCFRCGRIDEVHDETFDYRGRLS